MMSYKQFNKQKKIYVCDLDLKVSDGVGGKGMVQRKISDQYLTSGKVSTNVLFLTSENAISGITYSLL